MRYTKAKNRLARREGVDLGLKSKPIDITSAPGQHGGGKKFGSSSEFGKQLREKQKAKRIYGLTEKQFRNYYKKASEGRHPTGVTLLVSLERRLDNVIYRAGFALTRAQARQMVGHRVFLVNGKKIDIPSYQVKQGDVITVKERFFDHPVLREVEGKKLSSVNWLSVDVKKRTIEVSRLPEESDAEKLIDIQSIIEFYSR
jgi:small subunit ribosomal protein S4